MRNLNKEESKIYNDFLKTLFTPTGSSFFDDLEGFSNKLLNNQKSIEPEIAKIIDENFFELLSE
jgi:hypothetical protein